MSLRFKVSMFVCGFAAVLGILLAGSTVAAQTYYWTTSPSSIVGGGGSWDSVTPNWTQTYPGGGSNGAWVTGGNADFSGTGGAVSVSGNQTVGNITFDGSGYSLSGGPLTLNGASPTITMNAASATINSVLTGVNGLTTTGTGTLTLTATNTFTGGTTVDAGTLALNPPSGNTLGDGIIKGDLTINSGATVNLYNIWDLGYIQGQCVTSIEINNGTLDMGDGGSPNTITMSGGTIDATFGGNGFRWYHGNNSQCLTPTLYTLASGTTSLISCPIQLRLNATSGTLTFNVAQGTTPSGIDLLVSAAISQNEGGNVVKTGAGLMCFSANNTYTGATYVNAGTLQIGNGGSGEGLASPSIAMSNNATLAFNHSDTLSYAGAISGSGQFVKLGTGTLILSGSNTYTGPTTISAGTLQIGNGTSGEYLASPTVAVSNNATLAFNDSDSLAYTGVISGSGGLTKQGTGTLTLTATNTYTGGTTVNGGTLTLNPGGNYSNTLGTGIIRGPLTINPGATVYTTGIWALGYNSGVDVSSITINNGVLNNGTKGMGPQTITMSGGTISGSTAWYTYDTAATLNTIGGGTLALISAPMSINVSNLTFNVAQGSVPGGIDLLDSGGITPYYGGSYVYSITKQGAGLLCLSGNNNYTGGTNVDEGTLEATQSNAIPYGSGLTVDCGGTVVFADPPGTGATTVARSLHAASPAGSVAAVPEPGTLALLGVAGLIAAAATWRRRK